MKFPRLLFGLFPVFSAVSLTYGQQEPAAETPAEEAKQVAGADEEKLELARKVISLTRADRTFDQVMGPVKQMTAQSLADQKLPEAQRKQIVALQDKIMGIAMDEVAELVKEMPAVYAEVYTVEELKAMEAFFSSPEAQSMLDKQPKILEMLMPKMQQMQVRIQKATEELVRANRAASQQSGTGQ